MEGTLLKRIGRPLGMCVWAARQVRVTETAVEVVSNDKVTKSYFLADVHVVVVHLGAVAKGKYAFALVGNQDDEMRVTLAAESKFDHRRWVDAIEQAQANLVKKPSRRRRTAVFSPPPSATERKRRPLSESNRPTRTHMSFELVFRERPLGLDVGAGSQKEATLVGVSSDCELRDQLRLGDEIIGINSNLFVADPDEIETGGESSLSRDEVKQRLRDCKVPCTLVFRRPFVPPKPPRSSHAPPPAVPEHQEAPAVPTPAAATPPVTSEAVQKLLRMAKAGVPVAAVTVKAENELEPEDLQQFRAALNVKQETVTASAPPSLEKEDNPELEKYLKMKKLGAPPAQIVVKAEQNGASDATLKALRSKFGIAEVVKTPVKASAGGHHQQQQQYKGIHWQGIRDEDSTTKKRGSLWGRTKRRESLGSKAETMISENEEALELVDALFTAKKTPKKATLARPVSTPIDSGRSKEKVVELLDRQKALNLQIAMRGLLKNDVARGLRDLVATSSSDVDSLRSLRTALPTPEEIQRAALFAKKYPEDTKFTAATLLAVAAHDDWGGGQLLADIFDARLTLREFEGEANAAIEAASSAADLCAALKASKELRAAIHAALALGNRLNHGTNRSHAKAVSLADLERLEHTKANDGTSAIDALATLLDLDKKNRGEDGLDAEQIDAALRRLKRKLDSDKASAQRDRTFDVSLKLKTKKKRIETLLSQQKESPVVSSGALDAFEQFRKDCDAGLPGIEAALESLDLQLEDLKTKQNKLMDYTNEHESTIPSILDALDNFATSLVQARERQAQKWWWQK